MRKNDGLYDGQGRYMTEEDFAEAQERALAEVAERYPGEYVTALIRHARAVRRESEQNERFVVEVARAVELGQRLAKGETTLA